MTRLHEGYRLKDGVDLWEFLRDVKRRGQANAKEALKVAYSQLLVDPEKRKYWARLGVDPEKNSDGLLDLTMIGEAFRRVAREQQGVNEIHPLGLETGIEIRESEGRFYLIPFRSRMSIFEKVIDFIKDDERLEEYGVWDKPGKTEAMSHEEYEERVAIWGILKQPERWALYVSLDITPFADWREFAPTSQDFN